MKSIQQQFREDLNLEEELLQVAVQIYCANKQTQHSSSMEDLIKKSIEEAKLFRLVFKVETEY